MRRPDGSATNMISAELIAQMEQSGLREFGADRTPVAEKWKTVRMEREFQDNPIRVVAGLNNSDRNGALLALLKEDPEKIFEGMWIASAAVEAQEAYLYLPEWEEAYAEELAKQASDWDIEVKTGIVNVRESRGGAFHHFETLAAIADLFGSEQDTYRTGTYMAVCLGGETTPLTKVEYGTKVSEVIASLVGETEVQAVAIGTKIYDASALDLVIGEETQIGNGVITLFDPACCMIREAEQILLEERRHSCGKCTFCREGLVQLHTMTKAITDGQGKKEFPDLMREIGDAMTFSTSCTMGETAADVTLGTLKYFEPEYTDHIRKKKCAHGVCTSFLSIYIDPEECRGCGECADVCPKDAIDGKDGYIHMIDEFECDKCGKCLSVCENDAIIQTEGRVPKLPTHLTKVGKFKKRH